MSTSQSQLDRPRSVQAPPVPAVESQISRWIFAPFDITAAWATGWADYTADALRRGTSPLDVADDAARFLRVVSDRDRPGWSTRHQVRREWPTARLLDFTTRTGPVPTLVLPPQAGHTSTIVDYSPAQSQMRTVRAAGLTHLACLDWKPATQEIRDATIEDYLTVVDQAVAELGGVVNLVGDCQGGWLATLYAALHPQAINTLTIGAAPIDFHAGEAAIRDWMQLIGPAAELGPYRALVHLGGGFHRGRSQVTGFKLLEPAGEAERLAGLWAHIADPKYVQRYIDFTNWFEGDQDLGGAFYLWIVEHLFQRNELVQGTLTIGGEPVDLAAIDCPLFLLAGTSDHITPEAQVWPLAEHASTPEDRIRREVVDAGHLGLFMGTASLRDHWAPVLEEIAGLSGR